MTVRIFSTITPNFASACQRWLVDSVRNVEPSTTPEIVCFEEIHGSSDFQSESFNRHNVEKNYMVVDRIRANPGNIIFVTDSDIVYLRPFVRLLAQAVEGYDIALAWESTDHQQGYNIGQVVLRCSEKVAEFFELVGRDMSQGEWDQSSVNRRLQDSLLRHVGLPFTFANTAVWHGLPEHERRELVSYHATGTEANGGKSSLELKEEFIADVTQEWRRLQFKKEVLPPPPRPD